jgi:hypothetical protein
MRQLHWVGADALTTGIDQVVAAHATGNAMNGYERPAADRATPVIVCRGFEGIRNRLFSRDNHFTYAQLARSSTVLLEQPNPTD